MSRTMASLKGRGAAKVAPAPTPTVPAKKTLTAAEIRKAKAQPEAPKITPKTSARPVNQSTIKALKANRPNPEANIVKKTIIKKTPVPPSEFQNKQRLAAQAARRPAEDSEDDSGDDTPPPVRKNTPAKTTNRGSRSVGADVKIKQSTRKVEKFDPVVNVIVRKTAAQLREEKLNQNKNTVDPDEYQLIKKERMQEMEREKKVVKAKIIESKRKQADGDDETPYEYDYEEEEIESWDSDIEVPVKKVKELDPRKDGERVKKTMAMIRGKNPSEKIKVQDKDKEKYDVEDLSEDDNIATPSKKGAKNGPSKKEKMPVVQLDNLSKIINSKVSGNKRDILLVGLSESAKDAISDLLMETDIGKVGRIFDTSLEENEDKTIPKTSIAMFSEKVPILPLDERDEDNSSDDGANARARAKSKITAAKAADKTKKSTKKKVIAVGDVYEEAHFDVKKDYPSVRFIFLVKVSAADRVDMKKLHANVAYFTPIDKFKKKFMELTRAECLIMDLENRGQIYHMEFA